MRETSGRVTTFSFSRAKRKKKGPACTLARVGFIIIYYTVGVS